MRRQRSPTRRGLGVGGTRRPLLSKAESRSEEACPASLFLAGHHLDEMTCPVWDPRGTANLQCHPFMVTHSLLPRALSASLATWSDDVEQQHMVCPKFSATLIGHNY